MGFLITLLVLAAMAVLVPVFLVVTVLALLPFKPRRSGGVRDRGERRPHLRWYKLGLLVEHCAPELAVTVVAWSLWAGLFLALGHGTSAALVSAAAATVVACWWFSRPPSKVRRRHRAIEARFATTCMRLGIYSTGRWGQTLPPDLTNMSEEHGNLGADIRLPAHVQFRDLKAAEGAFAASFGGGNLRTLHIIGEDNVRTGRLYVKRRVAFDRHTTEPFPYRPGHGIAVKEDGTPMRFVVGADGPNVLIAGIKGSGKSGVVNAIVGETVAHRGKVIRHGIDPKEVELTPWEAQFDRLATSPADATQLLRDDLDEYARRREFLKAKGIRKVVPGCGLDPMVIFVDELRELVRDWDGEEKGSGEQRFAMLASLAALGRFAAMQIVVATQNPLAKHVGEIRQNCDLTICCRVRTETESFVALGDIGRELRPDRIGKDQRGVFWVVGDDAPYKARAVWLDDADVARIARAAP